MTIPTDNPAGRLYALLHEAMELGGFGRTNWLKVFELEEGENPDFQTVCKIVETLKLVDEVEEALLQVDDGTDVTAFLATLPDIKMVLARESIRAIDAPYGYDQKINVHLMNILGLGAQMLSARHSEPIVAEEQLTEVLQEVRELFEDVKSSGIDAQLRVFILRSLRQIENAIQHFRITGAKGLEDALVYITGELHYRQRDVATKASEDPTTQTWLARFTSIIAKVDSMIRFADTGMKALNAAKAAKSSLMALLGPGSGS